MEEDEEEHEEEEEEEHAPSSQCSCGSVLSYFMWNLLMCPPLKLSTYLAWAMASASSFLLRLCRTSVNVKQK